MTATLSQTGSLPSIRPLQLSAHKDEAGSAGTSSTVSTSTSTKYQSQQSMSKRMRMSPMASPMASPDSVISALLTLSQSESLSNSLGCSCDAMDTPANKSCSSSVSEVLSCPTLYTHAMATTATAAPAVSDDEDHSSCTNEEPVADAQEQEQLISRKRKDRTAVFEQQQPGQQRQEYRPVLPIRSQSVGHRIYLQRSSGMQCIGTPMSLAPRLPCLPLGTALPNPRTVAALKK